MPLIDRIAWRVARKIAKRGTKGHFMFRDALADNRDLDNTSALRTALDDLCGTQNTLKTAIRDAQKRPGTRAESTLASGAGTSADPATLGWEGVIDAATASLIRSQ